MGLVYHDVVLRGPDFRSHLASLISAGITGREAMANLTGVSISTVQRHLPPNLKRTGRYLSGLSTQMNPTEKAVIEGGILGDGRMIRNPCGAAFSFSNNKRDIVLWVSDALERLVLRNPSERYRQSRPINYYKGTYRFQTATWQNLQELAADWYVSLDPEMLPRQPWRYFRKTIPRAFRLTPRAGLLWYLGDGGLTKKSTVETSQVIRFATHDFPYSRLSEILVPQLTAILHADLNEIVLQGDKRIQGYPEVGYEIIVPARYVPRWLQYIGPCPQSIRSYA